jgi:hypothetical protein
VIHRARAERKRRKYQSIRRLIVAGEMNFAPTTIVKTTDEEAVDVGGDYVNFWWFY